MCGMLQHQLREIRHDLRFRGAQHALPQRIRRRELPGCIANVIRWSCLRPRTMRRPIVEDRRNTRRKDRLVLHGLGVRKQRRASRPRFDQNASI